MLDIKTGENYRACAERLQCERDEAREKERAHCLKILKEWVDSTSYDCIRIDIENT